MFRYVDVIAVHTAFGSASGSWNIRSSNNPQATSSMTFADTREVGVIDSGGTRASSGCVSLV